MFLRFEKWHGAGNDFILIEDPDFDLSCVPHLCHRRYGIGADGVIWFQPPNCMRIFNADGGEADTCGNALRCLAAAKNLTCINNRHHVRQIDGELAVSMGVPKQLDTSLYDTGVRHYVQFDGDFSNAPQWRKAYDANVNVAIAHSPNELLVRTYERGIEGETYSCGTGAVAVAQAARQRHGHPGPFVLRYRSGDRLTVFFEGGEAWLQGLAERTFIGQL